MTRRQDNCKPPCRGCPRGPDKAPCRKTFAWPRQESCCGIAVIPGKDLAGGLVDALDKGFVEARHLLILIQLCVLLVFTKICMPSWRCLLSLGSNVVVGNLGLEGGAFCWAWANCPGKVLAGAVEATRARVLPGETTSPSCSLCLCLGVALAIPRL